jgi:hypothetical protein
VPTIIANTPLDAIDDWVAAVPRAETEINQKKVSLADGPSQLTAGHRNE